MFGIGGQELVLLMVIGLIVLGPERLPRIANQVGGWLGQARRMTRVMKRQLEEELDLNQPPSIKPPPASREPSTKTETETISAKEPEYTLPRDDDDFSPAHGEEDPGTGVSEDIYDDEADLAASEAERAAVEEAARNPVEAETSDAEKVEKKKKKKEKEKEKERERSIVTDATETESAEEDLAEGTLLSHLVELRNRLLKIVGTTVVFFIVLLPWAADIFEIASEPLMKVLPGGQMIATEVASPLITPFKLTFFVALFIAMPVVLYQLWAFVAPGLYKKEKRFAMPLLGSSIVLFYLGVAFAYYLVFPLIFSFFTGIAPDNVEVQTDISKYLDFITTIIFAFGLAFEVPIATVLIVWTGLTTPKKLSKARPYVFLGAFVVGMFLTPPDVISQTFLAVPVYLLFELGIVMSRVFAIREEEPEEEEAATTE